jgi:aspartate/methionine/tyrosine aminotransferase
MSILPDFRLETYLAEWEFAARYHLTASDAESLSLADLLALADPRDLEAFQRLWLGYLPPVGTQELRAAIASTYETITDDQILTFAGGGEAVYVAMHALLEYGDHAIVVTPTYQSLETLALSLCAVTGVALNATRQWDLDLARVRDAIRPNTKLVVVNFPNNPTGKILPSADFDGLIEICREQGIWLLSDEVYRLIERDPSMRRPAAVDRYDRALSVSVMSKVYGLPGLRIGWIAARDTHLLQQMEKIKHYLSICNSAPSEALAVIALKASDKILNRNRSLVEANSRRVEQLFGEFPALFEWETPDGGTVGYPRYKGNDGVEVFTRQLVEEASVLLLPASIFHSELTPLPADRFRIGLGRSFVPAGLDVMRDWLRRNTR